MWMCEDSGCLWGCDPKWRPFWRGLLQVKASHCTLLTVKAHSHLDTAGSSWENPVCLVPTDPARPAVWEAPQNHRWTPLQPFGLLTTWLIEHRLWGWRVCGYALQNLRGTAPFAFLLQLRALVKLKVLSPSTCIGGTWDKHNRVLNATKTKERIIG